MQVAERRQEQEVLRPYAFLWSAYEPRYYYWEAVVREIVNLAVWRVGVQHKTIAC